MSGKELVGDVSGVKETIKVLERLEDRMLTNASTRSASAAQVTARELMAIAPAAPLSGMGGFGPVKAVSVKGGSKKGKTIPLAKVKLTGPGWTVSSDMARKSSPGSTMVQNLANKYGRASRWVYPTVEQRMKSIDVALKQAVEDTARDLNRDLAKEG